MIHADKFRLRCVTCGREYPPSPALYLCPDCRNSASGQPPRGVLKAVYDYSAMGPDLRRHLATGFIALLPILDRASLSPLQTGRTPLLRLTPPSDGWREDFALYLKDDARNPTYSLKDRASDVVSAYARECGIDLIAAASTGNAGSSLAGICASQGQRAVIFAPAKAPVAKLTQILHYGATLIPVDGTYDDAFAMCMAASERFGWYHRNTAVNPLTVEGKKTVALEIAAQIGSPDLVFVPVGDGAILTGVYKGFEDLLRCGAIDRMPTIVAVQAVGSSNLVANLDREEFRSVPARTRADSIAVDIPANFYWARAYLREYAGSSVLVTDDEILEASRLLGREYGVFAEPASAAAMAGLLAWRRGEHIPQGARVVVLNTGCGLKDPGFVREGLTVPDALPPDPDSLLKRVAELELPGV
jgi:threonine synthase